MQLFNVFIFSLYQMLFSADGEYVVTTLTKAILTYTGKVSILLKYPEHECCIVLRFRSCGTRQRFSNHRAKLMYAIFHLISRHAL